MNKNKTILLVDDQLSVIKSLKRLLVMEGFTILAASGGQAGLEILKKSDRQIRLIISDQRMPDMTGIDFLEKSKFVSPDSTKFLLSGYSDKDAVDKALDKRIIHMYLTKPWDNHELLTMINKVFDDKPVNIENDYRIKRSDLLETSGSFDFKINGYEDNIHDLAMGRLAVEHNFINSLQLREALSYLKNEKKSGKNFSLENILFEKKMITSDDVGRLIAATKRLLGREFGKEAIEKFSVSREEIESALKIQSDEFRETTTCRMLGDILVAEGTLEEEQRDSIIIDQLYSERIILYPDINIENETRKTSNNAVSLIPNDALIQDRKKKFFRQRALDKVLCRSVIKKGIVTSEEVSESLQIQLSHFGKTFKTLPVTEIFNSLGLIINCIATHKQSETKSKIRHENFTLNETVVTGETNHINLYVSEDRVNAYVRMNSITSAEKVGEALLSFLRDQGIKESFINKKLIRRLAKSSERLKGWVKIARGRKIQPGRNAFISYHFNDEKPNKGIVLESGAMDYKIRGPVPVVPANFLLATKHPLIKGKDGVDVYGETIKATEYTDEVIINGSGTVLSDNGYKIFSTTGGHPKISYDGTVSVLNELTINGNINFSTGHVQYDGNIIVKGTVLSGFRVHGASLETEEILDADIDIEGDIIVHGGIIGGTVRAGGSITAVFVKGVTLFAGGDVNISNEILEASIQTSGSCSVKNGRIVSSFISAKKHIEAVDIGTAMSQPSILRTGVHDHLDTITDSFNKQIERASEKLGIIKNDLINTRKQTENIQKKIGKLAFNQEELLRKKQQLKIRLHQNTKNEKESVVNTIAESDNASREMDKAISTFFDEQEQAMVKGAVLGAEIRDLKEEISRIELKRNSFCSKVIKEKSTPIVKATGQIHTGTVVLCNDSAYVVDETVKNSQIQEILSNSFDNRALGIVSA